MKNQDHETYDYEDHEIYESVSSIKKLKNFSWNIEVYFRGTFGSIVNNKTYCLINVVCEQRT